MTIFAILTVKSGNFNQGFEVSLAIKKEQHLLESETDGFLPPNPEIYSLISQAKNGITIDTNIGLYQKWHDWYITNLHSSTRELRNHSGITILPKKKKTQTEIKPVDGCQEAAKKLAAKMRNWLNSEHQIWQGICINLARALEKYAPKIQVVIKIRNIESEDITKQLWKLPWHEWNILDNHQVDVGLNITPSVPLPEQFKRQQHQQIRILHILGDDQNLNLEKDHEILKKSNTNAEIIPLIKPSHRQLVETLQQDTKGFDVLIFSGHSKDELGIGKFLIRSGENAEVEDLRKSFKRAIQYGLKLVIFNSCVSLSLAKALLNYGLAAVISMREEIPDELAHQFLETFWQNYVKGASIYTAFCETRTVLEGLEKEFPGASWLPIICQNLAVLTPLYQDLYHPDEYVNFKKLGGILTKTFITSLVILGIRHIGLLERFELKTYNLFLTSRPVESLDERILVVTINEDDGKLIDQSDRTISDGNLAKVLEKIQSYNPKVIGLDIFRDIPVGTGRKELITQLKNNQNNLYLVCQDGEIDNTSGISLPSEFPQNGVLASLLINDFDSVVRRQLLYQDQHNNICPTTNSLSFQLALHYFTEENIDIALNSPQFKVKNKVFNQLMNHSGGYHTLNDRGYQILLNYRGENTIEKISITDVLNRPELAQKFQDKIILIGYDFRDKKLKKDVFITPYGEMNGVIIHAQMLSQILSTVLDNRPLIWTLSGWGDGLLIIISSLLGGVIIWTIKKPFPQGLCIIITMISMGGSYYIMFWLQGLWLPLIPSVLVLLVPLIINLLRLKYFL